jgi:hypothetical protein
MMDFEGEIYLNDNVFERNSGIVNYLLLGEILKHVCTNYCVLRVIYCGTLPTVR